jgi:hypothetical protein
VPGFGFTPAFAFRFASATNKEESSFIASKYVHYDQVLRGSMCIVRCVSVLRPKRKRVRLTALTYGEVAWTLVGDWLIPGNKPGVDWTQAYESRFDRIVRRIRLYV